MDRGAIYWAKADGSMIKEVIHPFMTPNGIGLSPDERTLYVAETEGGKLYSFKIIGDGEVEKIPFPHSINGGILLNNEGGIKRFDSLAVENNGNICVGTLFNGGVTVISPSGELVEFIKFEDPYITNICFGSKDLQTAYITASYEGNLLEVPWARKGLALNFLNK
jgi:gluconolactonase